MSSASVAAANPSALESESPQNCAGKPAHPASWFENRRRRFSSSRKSAERSFERLRSAGRLASTPRPFHVHWKSRALPSPDSLRSSGHQDRIARPALSRLLTGASCPFARAEALRASWRHALKPRPSPCGRDKRGRGLPSAPPPHSFCTAPHSTAEALDCSLRSQSRPSSTRAAATPPPHPHRHPRERRTLFVAPVRR